MEWWPVPHLCPIYAIYDAVEKVRRFLIHAFNVPE